MQECCRGDGLPGDSIPRCGCPNGGAEQRRTPAQNLPLALMDGGRITSASVAFRRGGVELVTMRRNTLMARVNGTEGTNVRFAEPLSNEGSRIEIAVIISLLTAQPDSPATFTLPVPTNLPDV